MPYLGKTPIADPRARACRFVARKTMYGGKHLRAGGCHLPVRQRERRRRRSGRPGREALKDFTDWKDGRPETELNFKFYRQSTHKIGGISEEAAAFFDRFF